MILIRNYSFLALWIGILISILGDRLNYMAMLGLIFVVAPGSSVELSKLMIFIMLPAVLFGSFTGVFIDRWNRKNVLITSNIIRALLVLFIPITMTLSNSLSLVYIIVFWVWSFYLFIFPSTSALIPELVSPKELMTANSFISSASILATIAGVSIGGIIVELIGWRNAFYLNGIIYLISIAAFSSIILTREKSATQYQSNVNPSNPLKTTQPYYQLTVATEIKIFYHQIKEGWYYIKDNYQVRWLINMLLVMMLVAAVLYVAGIVLSQQITHKGTQPLGILIAVLGCGMAAGAVMLGRYGQNLSPQVIIGISFLMLGIVLCWLSYAESFLTLVYCSFVAGISAVSVIIIAETFLQKNVPTEFRGRIFSCRDMLSKLFLIGCVVIIGVICKNYGERTVLFWVGILTTLVGTKIVITVLFKRRNKVKVT